MEDTREAIPESALRHPVLIGALALPGALAGGGLALAVAERWTAGRVPDEPALFLGAFAGAFATLKLFSRLLERVLRAVVERGGAAAAPVAGPGSDPGSGPLHLVCARDSRWAARAVVALATPGLSRQHRILLMDGGLGTAFHAWFGGVPRLGLAECLSEGVPLLGLVQSGPAPGLYLLGRGGARRFDDWSQLGRVVREACSHFDRVVIVTDPRSVRELAPALRGEPCSAWWAGPGRSPRAPGGLEPRFAIPLRHMRLPPWTKVTPESVGRALGVAAAAGFEARARAARPLPGPGPVARNAGVLDCDLQVRERLRFLMWMKRVQTESPREADPAPIMR